jgi:hypothetical protein
MAPAAEVSFINWCVAIINSQRHANFQEKVPIFPDYLLPNSFKYSKQIIAPEYNFKRRHCQHNPKDSLFKGTVQRKLTVVVSYFSQEVFHSH